MHVPLLPEWERKVFTVQVGGLLGVEMFVTTMSVQVFKFSDGACQAVKCFYCINSIAVTESGKLNKLEPNSLRRRLDDGDVTRGGYESRRAGWTALRADCGRRQGLVERLMFLQRKN